MRLPRCLVSVCLIALVLTPVGLAADPPSSAVRVVLQDASGATLRLTTPRDALSVIVDDEGRALIRLPEVGLDSRPGAPELPVVVTTLAVPQGARVEVEWSARNPFRVDSPEPRPAPQRAADGSLYRTRDPRYTAPEGPFPEHPVRIEYLRLSGLRLARLSIHPLRYDAAEGVLVGASELTLRVRFVDGGAFVRPDALDPRFERLIANGEALRALGRSAPRPRATSSVRKSAQSHNPGVKIAVDEPGLIRVTGAQLDAIGFDRAGVDPRNLEMSVRGEPIPCRVVGEDDGSFDAGDAVEFYGVPGQTRYSPVRVYWLQERDAPGLRFAARSAAPGAGTPEASFPHTEHYEERNAIYSRGNPAEEGDPHFFWAWFEDNPNPPRRTTLGHTATLRDVAPGGQGLFRTFFAGRSDPVADPDHHARFRVNNNFIGDSQWNGQGFHTSEVAFDPALLNSGSNEFRIDFVEITFPDIYYMDWFEIVYPRLPVAFGDRLTVVDTDGDKRWDVSGLGPGGEILVLDITDVDAPVRLDDVTIGGSGSNRIASFRGGASGEARYLVAGGSGRTAPAALELDVPSTLRSTANGADLIIVTPEGWESSMSALVAHRQAKGLRVVLANLTDVADEFAGGNVDDRAIRDMVAWAVEHWVQPPPAHLLLVGEPNLDPQNWLEQDPFYSFMPTHFTVTSFQGETPSDNWFGTVDDSELPQVAVGRFSIRTPSEASNMAAKQINYENAETGTWQSRIVQVASNELPFELALERAALVLPAGFEVDSQYRREGATTGTVIDAVDQGALMVSFIGHGNVGFWADSPGGPFFDTVDVSSLNNRPRFPFVTALNCLNGLIADPVATVSLAEQFHRIATQGAIAVWSPASLGFLNDYDPLQQVMYEQIFEHRVATLGEITRASLVETILTRPVGIEIVREMILVGDPAGRIALTCDPQLTDIYCNGVDDDCDGMIDEDFVAEATTCGVGACESAGLLECINGRLIDSCAPSAPAPTDVTCNGIDEDCDGLADDGYVGDPTSCGVGECAATGSTVCVLGEVADNCFPLSPTEETCDGLDNDCDGSVDEDTGGVDTDLDGVGNSCDPDDDGDGVLDALDCASLIVGVSQAPGPIGDTLDVDRQAGVVRLDWVRGDQGHTSSIYRGAVPFGDWSYPAECLGAEVVGTTFQDADPPTGGTLHTYLIAASNLCGESVMTFSSAGAPVGSDPTCAAAGGDSDADGVPDVSDNCPEVANADQADADVDFVGDLCDNCPAVANTSQTNRDADPEGDACDDCVDGDGDGFGAPDHATGSCPADNCVDVANPDQVDSDADGLGDLCDVCPLDPDPNPDYDADGVCETDNCPTVVNRDQVDGDADGIGDACDDCTDSDGDGWGDLGYDDNDCDPDNCPLDANADQSDRDGDGLGDVCDPCPDGNDVDRDDVCGADRILVAARSSMRYLVNTSDPGVGNGWFAPAFSDAGWPVGLYGVGYDTLGDASGLIRTEVPAGARSLFTRSAFQLEDVDQVSRLTISADYDDAFAVWLNGVEIYRSPEVSAGPLPWDATVGVHESSNESQPNYGDEIDVTAQVAGLLFEGQNLLAVAVWNDSTASSDLVLVPRLIVRVGADNCPGVVNPDQADADGDGLGDACDSD